MMNYTNPMEGIMSVYADSAMQKKIGTLYKGSTCKCIAKHEDTAIILFKINTLGEYKVGFADPRGIQP